MGYSFIKFEGARGGNRGSAIVIQKPNSIGFSSQFYRDNNVVEFKFAVLYYDQGSNAIGIRLTNQEDEPSKYAINHARRGHSGSISPKSFFTQYDIDINGHVGRHEWVKEKIDGIGDLFIIKLTKKQPELIN